MHVSSAEWFERRRPLTEIVYRQRLISAAFGLTFSTEDKIMEALTIIYREELGTWGKTAKALGIDSSTLYRRMKQWDKEEHDAIYRHRR